MSKPPAGILPFYIREQIVLQYELSIEGEPVRWKKIPKKTIIDDVARQGVFNDFSDKDVFAKIKVHSGACIAQRYSNAAWAMKSVASAC